MSDLCFSKPSLQPASFLLQGSNLGLLFLYNWSQLLQLIALFLFMVKYKQLNKSMKYYVLINELSPYATKIYVLIKKLK